MTPDSAQTETGRQGRPRETGASLRVGPPAWLAPGLVSVVGVVGAGIWASSHFSRAAELHRSQSFYDFVWTVLDARTMLWSGGITHLYHGNGSILVALPGFPIVLAALIKVLTLVGVAAPSVGLARGHGGEFANYLAGGSWYVIYPFATAAGLSALFPLDALARRCGITGLRRWTLTIALGAGFWWMAVLWGHPEDGLAVAFLAWVALRALDGRWTSAGWLLGLGIAIQPLVLLGAPVIFMMAGVRRWPRLAVRSAIPGLLAVAIPLFGDPSDTLRQVLKQPTYNLNPSARVTPWVGVVPHPGVGVVDAGWPRVVAVLLACLVGFLAVRWWGRSGVLTPPVLVWTLGILLSLRCVFESVVFGYYLVPPVAFLLLAAFGRGRLRAGVALVLGLGLAFVSRPHFGEWAFWGLMMLGLAALAALGFPGRPSANDELGESGDDRDVENVPVAR